MKRKKNTHTAYVLKSYVSFVWGIDNFRSLITDNLKKLLKLKNSKTPVQITEVRN